MKAIYAFSGDPITYGHIDIILRASKVFDKVVVGIGVNPAKNYTFSLEERTDMARRSLANVPNAEVAPFRGLLVDYAYENSIPVIIRGVRDQKDFDAETEFHRIGDSQKLGIDTYLLLARPELAHISSSAVKALQKEQGMIHGYVPLYVKQRLEEMVSGQYIVGLTGEIGAGKSYVGRKFQEFAMRQGMLLHNIELDCIGRQILGDLKQPRYREVREAVARTFGKTVMQPDGTIDLKALGELAFSDLLLLRRLNGIMETPVNVRLRREIYGKKGLVLLNAELIAEADSTYLCNNNAILVEVDKGVQMERLAQRGSLSPEQIRRRVASQYDSPEKKARLEQVIERDKQGMLWTLDNSREGNESAIRQAFETVVGEMHVK